MGECHSPPDDCDAPDQQTLSSWQGRLGPSHTASWRPVWRECQVSSLEIQWICHHPRAAHPTCSPWCQWGHQGCNFSSCMPSRHWLTRGWDGRVMSLCTAAWIRTQACLVAKALWWWCHVGWTLGLALLLGVQTIGLDQKRLQTHNLMCMSVPHICYTHVLYTNNDTEKIVEVRAWFELTALSTHLWLLSALTALSTYLPLSTLSWICINCTLNLFVLEMHELHSQRINVLWVRYALTALSTLS